jgi:hypothetical protein
MIGESVGVIPLGVGLVTERKGGSAGLIKWEEELYKTWLAQSLVPKQLGECRVSLVSNSSNWLISNFQFPYANMVSQYEVAVQGTVATAI